jgi:hypothetical protein
MEIRKSRINKRKNIGVTKGYKSGLEEKVAKALEEQGITGIYETLTIKFVQPEKKRSYKPDFPLPNGVIVETKGRFTTEDRQKHLWIQEQHPELDIRFVFSNSKAKINKGSKTTYGDWCDNNGFLYADKEIPREWIKE